MLWCCSSTSFPGSLAASQEGHRQHNISTNSRMHHCTKLQLLLSILATCACALSPHGHHSMHASSSSGSSGRSSSEILKLPGLQGALPSKHYAGYITVDPSSQRQLYFYLVSHEVEQGPSTQHQHQHQHQQQGGQEGGQALSPADDPAADTPLIIWLTGGPGCSSLDAFTYENGPFTFTAPAAESAGREATLKDIQLTQNPHSWSKSAHIVYIDSPAGTGFSHTPGQRVYHTDDDKTIQDLEVCVAGFFEEHPWLRQQPLYIAGESYGGVYAPLLTRALLRHNQRLQQQQQAQAGDSGSSSSARSEPYNLAGYIVGNAVTDDFYDTSGQADFAFSMGLVDSDTYRHVKQACKANGWNVQSDRTCAAVLRDMEDRMGPINPYNILGKCFKSPSSPSTPQVTAALTVPATAGAGSSSTGVDYRSLRSSRKLQQQQQPKEKEEQTQGSQLTSTVGAGRLRAAQQLRHAVACADRRYASVYYNSPEVRTAIHAAASLPFGRWEPCSDVLHYTNTAGSMIPVHLELQEAGVPGLVLSGDADYVVPYTGTRAWVYDLALKQSKPWHSWHIPGDDQVAGYAVEFENGLTFATVKGAGHMVPQTHPQAALALLQQWLARQL